MENKKGQMGVIGLFDFVFAVFFIAIALGLAFWGFHLITDTLRIDVEIGQVNLEDITNSTLGQLDVAFVNSVDTIGIMLLLGMSLLMILNAYFFGQSNKVFLFLDIFIIIIAFILAVYLSSSYDILINASPTLNIFIDNLPNTSTFVLRLPIYVATLGAILLIVSYSGLRRRNEGGDPNVSGF